MSIEIVSEVQRGSRWGRVRRGLVGLLGNLLILVGLLAATPFVMLVLLMIVLGGGDPSNLDSEALGQLALVGTVAVVCLFVGFRLRRGKRRLILFLRRFGFDGASRVLTFAVTTALGRSWRLVTLDDLEIVPVGVSGRTRRAWGVGRWVILGLAVAGLLYGVSWIYGGGPEEIAGGIFESTYENAVARGDNPFVAIFGAFIAALVVGIAVVALAIVVIFLPIAALGTLTFFSWFTWRTIRKAERTKALEVREEDEIDPVVSRVDERTAGVFAPRLVVLRSAHEIWRGVVHKLADAADVVLIDVSEPTGSLLWEVGTLKERVGSRWILVGHRDRVEALAAGEVDADEEDVVSRLRELLEGEQVLVYEGEEEPQMRRFAESFRARLEAMAPELDADG